MTENMFTDKHRGHTAPPNTKSVTIPLQTHSTTKYEIGDKYHCGHITHRSEQAATLILMDIYGRVGLGTSIQPVRK